MSNVLPSRLTRRQLRYHAPVVDRRASLGDVLTADGNRLSMRAVVPILQTPEIHALLRSEGHEAVRDLCRTLYQISEIGTDHRSPCRRAPPSGGLAFAARAARRQSPPTTPR